MVVLLLCALATVAVGHWACQVQDGVSCGTLTILSGQTTGCAPNVLPQLEQGMHLFRNGNGDAHAYTGAAECAIDSPFVERLDTCVATTMPINHGDVLVSCLLVEPYAVKTTQQKTGTCDCSSGSPFARKVMTAWEQAQEAVCTPPTPSPTPAFEPIVCSPNTNANVGCTIRYQSLSGCSADGSAPCGGAGFYVYATIDGAYPQGMPAGGSYGSCTENFVALPLGWELVPGEMANPAEWGSYGVPGTFETFRENVMGSHRWETTQLVLADGTSWNPNVGNCNDPPCMATAGSPATGNLVQDGTSDSYKVSQCDQRVFIRRPE